MTRLIGTYSATNYGQKEVDLMNAFYLQSEDAYQYFYNILRPRYERYYKLFVAFSGDRKREIKTWQANVFVPYVQAVIETMMPRILDARPDFTVIGRTSEDNLKAEKQQQLCDYLWEISGMDGITEDVVRSSLMYGTGFMQVSWKKDVRKLKFLKTKDIGNRKYKWQEEERTFYDAPFCEWVDNFALWYDWHNIDRKLKQYWFKRLVLSANEIRRRYPMADPERLEMAINSAGGDLTDYAAIRQLVKSSQERITKDADRNVAISYSGVYYNTQRYQQVDSKLRMYEVKEWWRPYEDTFAVMVGGSRIPILRNGFMPIPYDFKEAPFIDVPYLKIPGEFEGYGLASILESPQILLNTIKNQRLDAATLSIHKMWIVNPLANINKDELVTRPFGIIYSIDPQGVREVQFSDIKASAYKEEDLLKSDMQYASGVDDASMGMKSGANATEIRHLRESTLERVRLFINHLGAAYGDVLRYWMDMERQLFTKEMTIRVIGDNGDVEYPLIEKDDLCGKFDYRASVLPSIAGQQDVQKKQDMDLFQLLISLPFIDQRKLTAKVLGDWGWSLDNVAQSDQGQAQQGMPGMPATPGGAPGAQGAPQGMGAAQPQDLAAMSQLGAGGPPQGQPAPQQMPQTSTISPQVVMQALSLLRKPGEEQGAQGTAFGQAAAPINLLRSGMPPTAPSAGLPPPATHGATGPNPRGHNRTGKVNTNISKGNNSNPESQLQNRALNIQR